MNDKDRFIIKTDLGEDKSFYKLVTFKSNITNKNYLIYCDENKNIFGSILISDDSNGIKLEKELDNIDIEEVNKAIFKVKKQLEEN